MYAKLINNLVCLKMDKTAAYIKDYLDDAVKKEVGLVEALAHLTDVEIEHRTAIASKAQITVANFPYVKRLGDYDFTFQPSVNKGVLYDLATLRFVENKENVLFFGTPGVGKTHLATALGIEAASKRQITYFTSCHGLIQNLKKAHDENRLEARLKHYGKYKVLIIDEIGYLPVDRHGANLFFQLITRRYERTSTIVTTNQPFSKWGEVFSDLTLANAILDRLLHHSHVVKIIGPSYRTKDVRELINEEGE